VPESWGVRLKSSQIIKQNQGAPVAERGRTKVGGIEGEIKKLSHQIEHLNAGETSTKPGLVGKTRVKEGNSLPVEGGGGDTQKGEESLERSGKWCSLKTMH